MNAANMYFIENEQGANWTGEKMNWNSYIQEWPNIPKGLSGDYLEKMAVRLKLIKRLHIKLKLMKKEKL